MNIYERHNGTESHNGFVLKYMAEDSHVKEVAGRGAGGWVPMVVYEVCAGSMPSTCY